MSEIGTLAAQWLPLLVARAGTATLRAAVRDFKAIETLAKITLTPSPSDCRVVPDLPRVFQLDNDQLKNFLPGTLLLPNGGETRYVLGYPACILGLPESPPESPGKVPQSPPASRGKNAMFGPPV